MGEEIFRNVDIIWRRYNHWLILRRTAEPALGIARPKSHEEGRGPILHYIPTKGGKGNNYIKSPSHLIRTDYIYLSDSILSIILCKYKTIQRKFEEKSLSGPYKDSKLFINARF